MAKKVVLIVLAEYPDDVTVKQSELDDDADSYMYEFFSYVTGNDEATSEASIDGVVVVTAEDMTLARAKELVSGIAD